MARTRETKSVHVNITLGSYEASVVGEFAEEFCEGNKSQAIRQIIRLVAGQLPKAGRGPADAVEGAAAAA